jgi:hypothetical protein
MTIQKVFSQPVLYIGFVTYILLGYTVLANPNETLLYYAINEDKFFEWVGALSFFAASLFFGLAFWELRKKNALWLKRLALLCLAALFFFAGGEEISWGQRIFGLETPEALKEVNKQKEITVHNIEVPGLGQIPFENLFDVLWLGFTVVLPLAALAPQTQPWLRRLLPVTHLGVGILFLFNYFWAKAVKLMYAPVYIYSRVPFPQAVQEIKESHYALLFSLAAFYVWRRTKQQPHD